MKLNKLIQLNEYIFFSSTLASELTEYSQSSDGEYCDEIQSVVCPTRNHIQFTDFLNDDLNIVEYR